MIFYSQVKQILSLVSNESDLKENSGENNIFRQIDLDIHRTFPNHKMFVKDSEGVSHKSLFCVDSHLFFIQFNEKISKLRKILISYCVCVNPTVGYCQGMNFIGALLLIIFEGNEEYSLMYCISTLIFNNYL